MPLETEAILKALKEMRDKTKKRNFIQSVELIINLRDIDLKRPENRISEIVELPCKLGKEVKVCVFASGDAALKAKKAGLDTISREEIEAMAGDKKKQKNLAKTYDFFIAEATLMPLIGRILGSVFGPRGKMPTPVPPSADIVEIAEKYKRMVRIQAKKQPVIHCRVGTENMKDEEIAKNIQAVISKLEDKLERGMKNIQSIYIKMTMGPAVRVV